MREQGSAWVESEHCLTSLLRTTREGNRAPLTDHAAQPRARAGATADPAARHEILFTIG